MLVNWLKRKIQRAGVRGAREDLESFVESLRGQSDEELGMVVAIAAIVRTELRSHGHVPDEMLEVTNDPQQALTQLEMSRLVRRYQAEKRFQEALGAMVWLHTLRSLSTPELRFLGRQLWQQLERGHLHALEAMEQIEAMTGNQPPLGSLAACAFIPDDLDPVGLE